MKKYRWIIWLVILALAGAAVWYWKFRKEEQPIVLETEQPKIGYIASSVTATGTIQPVDTVAVGTQISGVIQKIYVDFNSQVKQGQLIAQLDKSLLEAQVQQISASLAQTQTTLAYSKSNFDRQAQLLKVGAISQADYENAQNQYNTAKENVNGIAAQLKAAQKNLSYTDIYSPINGTVLARNVNVGQTVAASFSTPTLFVIAKDLTKMQVRASVDEADIGNLQKGQRVNFNVDAFPDDVFQGTVQDIRLEPSVSANVVTYTTIIGAPNNDMRLKPGMTASITVFTKEINNTLLISARATKFKPDSSMLKKFKFEGLDKGEGRGSVSNEGPRSFDGSGRKGGDSTMRKHRRDSSMASNGDTSMHHHHRRDTTSQDPANSSKRAIVWIKKDSLTIERRPIEIGMTDNTNVQVISGLSTSDVVVDGVQTGPVEKSSQVRSPFMPARRGGGGGGGGGGNRPAGGGGAGGGGGNRPAGGRATQ